MEQILPWIVSVVSGAIGGNVAGAVNKAKGMGGGLNSIVGAIGGLIGGQGLGSMIDAVQDLGMGGNAGISGSVGLVLTFIVSKLKK